MPLGGKPASASPKPASRPAVASEGESDPASAPDGPESSPPLDSRPGAVASDGGAGPPSVAPPSDPPGEESPDPHPEAPRRKAHATAMDRGHATPSCEDE